MNGDTKIEQFNQLVRSIVTLGMTAGFIWMALRGTITSELYGQTFTMIVTFWFVSRSILAATAASSTTTTTTGGTTTTTTPAPVTPPPPPPSRTTDNHAEPIEMKPIEMKP